MKYLRSSLVIKILKFIYLSRDAGGAEAWYQAISVIEFKGTLSPDGDSNGHYFCDVKDKITNFWYKTSDEIQPVPIATTDVVLFKRV